MAIFSTTQHSNAMTISHTAKTKRVCGHEPKRMHIDSMLRQRQELEEEVRQLRAAVQIYTEVIRRLKIAVAA